MDNRPIGIFDSGVGGLTIWRATRQLLPRESLIFLADSLRVPYGERPAAELCELSRRMTSFLLGQDVKLVVVACNTASVHALGYLRATFPHMQFVGVVPVVKTLARKTRSGVIAILSTPATAESGYLAGLIGQFAANKRVINLGCDGLGEAIEAGKLRSPETRALLMRHLGPLQDSGVDVIGLGCTHYPFMRGAIKQMLGEAVQIYDPARPVARRVKQLLNTRDAFACQEVPFYRFYTTGSPEQFTAVARRLLRRPLTAVELVEL